jgi:hypothetical protein
MLVLVANVGDDVQDLLARDGENVTGGIQTAEKYYEQQWGVSLDMLPRTTRFRE